MRRFQYLNRLEMPWLATNLDTLPENPETKTVSGFLGSFWGGEKKIPILENG